VANNKGQALPQKTKAPNTENWCFFYTRKLDRTTKLNKRHSARRILGLLANERTSGKASCLP